MIPAKIDVLRGSATTTLEIHQMKRVRRRDPEVDVGNNGKKGHGESKLRSVSALKRTLMA